MAFAILGALGAATLARKSVAPQPVPPPIKQPVRNPFPSGIAGAGLVEASSENIVIGVSEPGLVTRVYVKEGQNVKAGAPLFEVDSRGLQAQLLAAKANLASAEAELNRVKAYRRKEEEAPLRAKVAQAQASLLEAQRAVVQAEAVVTEAEWSEKDAEAKMRRLQATVRAAATPEEELERMQYQVKIASAKITTAKENVKVAQSREAVAKAALQQAQAELDIFLAGAWEPDIEKAKAAVAEARARIEQFNTEIERRIVRAPIDSSVIRLNLRQGEYASTLATQPENAPVVLGDIETKNVRIDIDEFDARRYRPGARAIAYLKGGSDAQIPLEFQRVEPFVIPKRALTNSQREIVDTRVLQVIYKIKDAQSPIYPGQQLDVFIEAPPDTQ
ncbi:MAG TPA: biotin/lipoyl-binding protein [Planctomycetota bacterium]|nr:biotin/lipoyl-binding protein [Planctomycetota bacterium]